VNLYDKILIVTFLFAIIVWQALHQANLFKQNKTISHFWKGVWYSCAVVTVTIPFISLYDWWYALKIPAVGLLERLALFDFALSLARGKPLFYNGKDSTSSIIDKVENELSEEFLIALKGSYVVIFLLVIIFIK
jgi:hypothetical protein